MTVLISKVRHYVGLSTDLKPAGPLAGSTFTETDTQKEFIYDGMKWTRGSMIVVEEERATSVLLGEILTELKINNAHLAMVTGEKLDDTDIPREA